MTHPLFTLISQQQESAPESPPVRSGTSVADFPPVAAATQQRTRGEAERCVGAEAAEPSGLVVEPGMGLRMPGPLPGDPGVSILAVIDPPGPDGTPGRSHFAPGLTRSQIREILFDIEWFDVRVRRCEGKES